MADYTPSVPSVLSLLLGLALLALVAWAYLSQAASHAYPENEANAFIMRSNNALAPVLGAGRVPLMPEGINFVVGQGVLGRSASEFEYSAFKEAERRIIKTDYDVYYKIVVNSRSDDYYALFTPKDLRAFGYEQSNANTRDVTGSGEDTEGNESTGNIEFWTRVFAAGDAEACKNELISLSSAAKMCLWTECAAPVCVHSFFKCGETQVDWLLESSQALRQTALNTNEEIKRAFSEVC